MCQKTQPFLYTLLIIFTIVPCWTGCKKNDPPQTTDSIILAHGTSPEDYQIDPYTFEDTQTDGDILQINLSYSGGCEEHTFTLVAYNFFMESFPIQAAIVLSHNAQDDPCEAFITQTLLFDLTPLKEAYLKQYPDDLQGTIMLQLWDPVNLSSIIIEYNFESYHLYSS